MGLSVISENELSQTDDNMSTFSINANIPENMEDTLGKKLLDIGDPRIKRLIMKIFSHYTIKKNIVRDVRELQNFIDTYYTNKKIFFMEDICDKVTITVDEINKDEIDDDKLEFFNTPESKKYILESADNIKNELKTVFSEAEKNNPLTTAIYKDEDYSNIIAFLKKSIKNEIIDYFNDNEHNSALNTRVLTKDLLKNILKHIFNIVMVNYISRKRLDGIFKVYDNNEIVFTNDAFKYVLDNMDGILNRTKQGGGFHEVFILIFLNKYICFLVIILLILLYFCLKCKFKHTPYIRCRN
jgi:hypothetical protein